MRDADDDLEVQTRTKPWDGRNVAINIAIAMRIAGSRLGFYNDGTTRLDGETTEFAEGKTELAGGGEVWRRGASFIVVWPDNTQVRFELGSFMSVRMYLPDARRRGGISGLLGDFDGDVADDVTTRDGTALADPAPFATFYGVYAESWRIAQSDSLFDYAPGEDTETFTDRSFPRALATAADLSADQRAAALTSCQAAQVADEWLDACLLDVGLTGEEGFADDLAGATLPRAAFAIEPPPDACAIPSDRVCDAGSAYAVEPCASTTTLIEACAAAAPCTAGYCLAPTSAALRGLVKDATTNDPVAGVLVAVRHEASPVAALYTGATGLYSLELAPGGYELRFSAPGYVEATLIVELVAGEVTTVTGLRQVPAVEGALGGVRGVIEDSITGLGVAGLYLALRRGIGATAGEPLAETMTGAGGAYELAELEPGNYSVTASGEGYVDAVFDVVVVADAVTADQNASIAPRLAAGELRIVLSWKVAPRDLDSHLISPVIEGGSYEISYARTGSESAAPYAKLDVDATSGFGPETITIYRRFPGTYRYRVRNYSGEAAIITSDARVEVYDETGLAHAYVVPTSGAGIFWTVFELDGATGTLTSINRIEAN